MNVSRAWGVLALAVCVAAGAAGPTGENLTWQEANKRSAALIRENGPNKEAADLARLAFDLYPQQARSYKADSHAQLLMNAVDTRGHAVGWAQALEELERGVAVVTQHAGSNAPVLVEVWRRGAEIAIERGGKRDRYYGNALAVAERVWGADDPRTLKLSLNMIHDGRRDAGPQRSKEAILRLRERAAKAGEDSVSVAECDLLLAKLELETGREDAAIEGLTVLVARLEKRADRDQDTLLMVAYGLLEVLYEDKGKNQSAEGIRARRSAWVEQHPSLSPPDGP
jgi:hypothetical protein